MTLLLSWCISALTQSAAASPADPLILSQTQFTVPAEAVFVAPDGSDAAPGTIDAPLRSLQAGLRRVPTGGTLVIRAGTYREAFGPVTRRVTIQPFPGETVWIKGSTVLRRWRAAKGAWVHAPWHTPFCRDCTDPRIAPDTHPVARRAEQLFLDGTPLAQIAERGALGPGRFFVDDKDGALWIGSDPNGHLIEAAMRTEALVFLRGSAGSTLRGLGFSQFSPPAQDGYSGMVKGDARDLTITQNAFADSAAVGLNIYASGAVISGNRFVRNGLAGLGAWRADGLRVTGNLFAQNNHAGFAVNGPRAAAAGAKITKSRDITVEANQFINNAAHGLWLDLSVIGAKITGNTVTGSAGDGIFVELSAHATLRDNTVRHSRDAGLRISGSHKVTAQHNLLVENGVAVSVIDDARTNPDAAEVAQGAGWVTGDVVVTQNRMHLPADAPRAWHVRDYSAALTPQDMIARHSPNTYHLPDPHVAPGFAEWWRGTQRLVFDDPDSWRDAITAHR